MRESGVGVGLLPLLSYLCARFGWLRPVNWGSPAPELLLLLISKTYLLPLSTLFLNIRN